MTLYEKARYLVHLVNSTGGKAPAFGDAERKECDDIVQELIDCLGEDWARSTIKNAIDESHKGLLQ